MKPIVNTDGHLGNNIFSMFANVLFSLFGFFIFFIVIRTYPKETYAEWVYYITVLVIIEYLRSGLIRTALIKHLSGIEDESEKRSIIGSGWVINVSIVGLFFVVFYAIRFISLTTGVFQDYQLVFTWYPLYALASSALNLSEALLQAQRRYPMTMLLRVLNQGGLLLFCAFNYGIFHFPVQSVVIAQIVVVGAVSLLAVGLRLTGVGYLFHAQKNQISALVRFGKYSMGTSIGGNLLKNSDIIIISLMLTRLDVALYSVPLKALDIIQVPLDSFSNVAFPFLSRAGNRKDMSSIKDIFYRYTGVLTIFYIPVSILLFIFSDFVILLLSGRGYLETGATVSIFRIFLICGLFLPLDRFTGNVLDSLGAPRYNFIKVMTMLAVNVAGDVAVILMFRSIEAVALVTVLTFVTGIVLGYGYLRRKHSFRFFPIFRYGIMSIKNNGRKLGRRLFQKKGAAGAPER